MQSLYVVKNGTAQFYCQEEQVEYWSNQGMEVYELQMIPANKAAVSANETPVLVGSATAETKIENEPQLLPMEE